MNRAISHCLLTYRSIVITSSPLLSHIVREEVEKKKYDLIRIVLFLSLFQSLAYFLIVFLLFCVFLGDFPKWRLGPFRPFSSLSLFRSTKGEITKPPCRNPGRPICFSFLWICSQLMCSKCFALESSVTTGTWKLSLRARWAIKIDSVFFFF